MKPSKFRKVIFLFCKDCRHRKISKSYPNEERQPCSILTVELEKWGTGKINVKTGDEIDPVVCVSEDFGCVFFESRGV